MLRTLATRCSKTLISQGRPNTLRAALPLAARRFATASVPTPAAPAPAPAAAASSSTPAKESSNAPAAQINSFGDIVKSMGGWYPFLGAAATIAVTKELFVWNEEALMATNFMVAAFAMYIAVGDMIPKMAEEERQAGLKKLHQLADISVLSSRRYVDALSMGGASLDMYKALKYEYNQNIRKVYEVSNQKAQARAAEAVLKRLAEIRSRESAERGQAASSLIANASAFVRTKITQLSEKEQSQILENALDLLSGKVQTIPIDRDPVKKLYVDYIQTQQRK